MWRYEPLNEDEPLAPDTWRVYDDSDPSYEATICELWSGEHDNETLAKEICDAHNRVAKLEQCMNPRTWTVEMRDAWHKNLPDVHAAFAALREIADAR